MKIKNLTFVWTCGMILAALFFTGCAGPKLYSVNMYYDAQQAVIPANLKNNMTTDAPVISVAELTDSRKIDDTLVIGRVVETDGMQTLIFPKTVQATKTVSNGMKNYLRKAGYKVNESLEQWDLKEESIPQGNARMLIGGTIEELDIVCRKSLVTNSYNGNIKLNIIFADMAKGKILYSTTVESSYAREHVLFSENILGEQADIILGDAIEKLFEDKVVIQKFKEALAP